jgi:hypothetical protein
MAELRLPVFGPAAHPPLAPTSRHSLVGHIQATYVLSESFCVYLWICVHVCPAAPLLLHMCLCVYATGRDRRRSSDEEGKTAHKCSGDSKRGSNPDFTDAGRDVVASPAKLVAVCDEGERRPADGTVRGAYDEGGTVEASSAAERAFARLVVTACPLWPGLGTTDACSSTTDFCNTACGQVYFLVTGCAAFVEVMTQFECVLHGYGRCTQDMYTREHQVVMWSNLWACARWTGFGLLAIMVSFEGRYRRPSRSAALEYSMVWGAVTFFLGTFAEIAQILVERHRPGWTLHDTLAIDGVSTLDFFSACIFVGFWLTARFRYDHLIVGSSL